MEMGGVGSFGKNNSFEVGIMFSLSVGLLFLEERRRREAGAVEGCNGSFEASLMEESSGGVTKGGLKTEFDALVEILSRRGFPLNTGGGVADCGKSKTKESRYSWSWFDAAFDVQLP